MSKLSKTVWILTSLLIVSLTINLLPYVPLSAILNGVYYSFYVFLVPGNHIGINSFLGKIDLLVVPEILLFTCD